MPTTKRPLVHDSTNNAIAPLPDGQTLPPDVVPVSSASGQVLTVEDDGLLVEVSGLVSEASDNQLKVQDGKLLVEKQTVVSTDEANVISTGSDGGAYIKQADFVNEVVGMIQTQLAEADHVSTDTGNYLRLGTDKLAYLGGNDILSNGGINLLTIDPTDGRIILSSETLNANIDVGGFISSDENNHLVVGSDCKLFVASPVSADAGNAIVEGSDLKAYFPTDWGTME